MAKEASIMTKKNLNEGYLKGTGGCQLHYRFQEPTATKEHSTPTAAILICHGYGEHLGRYNHVTKQFLKHNYAVFRFDYRGHGNSDGPRGHIDSFEDYLNDTEIALDAMMTRCPDLPSVILGHSQGGLIALSFLAERKPALVAAAVTSPFLGFGLKVPAWKAFIGRLCSQLMPALALSSDVDNHYISHDSEVVEAYENDPLVHSKATSRWFTEILSAHLNISKHAGEIELPILIFQAGDDRLVSAADTEAVFEKISSLKKIYHLYPGLYHELLNEPEGAEILDRIIQWLNAQIKENGNSK
jgi:lysophospholipase